MNWHDLGSTSLSATAVTAATSSVITKTLLFPMDTIKCRLQAGVPVWRFQGLWNGLLPKILLYSPYQALYMSSYTQARNWLHSGDQVSLFVFPLAGCFAELSAALIRVPMETVKQRMQAGMISSNRELVREIRSNPREFFKARNFRAQTLVHDLPCGALHWLVYESIKRRAWDRSGSAEPAGVSAGTAGAVAGISTAILTNPLDVIKTRMITRPTDHPSARKTVQTILQSSGLRGLYKGVAFRILHIAPNSALYMWIFDHIFQYMNPS